MSRFYYSLFLRRTRRALHSLVRNVRILYSPEKSVNERHFQLGNFMELVLFFFGFLRRDRYNARSLLGRRERMKKESVMVVIPSWRDRGVLSAPH